MNRGFIADQLQRVISNLRAQLDEARRDLRDARQSVTYYREQCQQLRSENDEYRRRLTAQRPRQNPGPFGPRPGLF